MDYPKRCFSCGFVLLEEYYELYFESLRQGMPETKAFALLKAEIGKDHFVKGCCTTMIITARPCASNTLYLLPKQ